MHLRKRLAASVLLIIICLAVFCSCNGDEASENTSKGETTVDNSKLNDTVYAEITMENGGLSFITTSRR